MTKETLEALGTGAKYNALTPTEVKGKSAKLEVFELTGIA